MGRVGTYHTFFAATEAELDRLFPGWMPVHRDKVTVEVMNPFTKKMQTSRTWGPVEPVRPLQKPNLYDDVWGPPVPSLLLPSGQWADYERAIEEAAAPGLRALPHFRGKNLTLLYTFESLTKALVGSTDAVPPARVGDPADDDMPVVERLPANAVARLASLGDHELEPTFLAWGEADLLGEEVEPSPENIDAFVRFALVPLRALAALAVARGASLCSYTALHY